MSSARIGPETLRRGTMPLDGGKTRCRVAFADHAGGLGFQVVRRGGVTASAPRHLPDIPVLVQCLGKPGAPRFDRPLQRDSGSHRQAADPELAAGRARPDSSPRYASTPTARRTCWPVSPLEPRSASPATDSPGAPSRPWLATSPAPDSRP
jgi:hypothetical protein